MPLWKLILSYDGTPYNGWQVQPNLPTVQGTLAAAIHHITGETVLPQGSGRTDTGVHALAQVASFELTSPIPPANLHRALNRALPPSIRVLAVETAPTGFHARHSARRKTYEYRIFPRVGPHVCGDAESICSPMLAPFVWDCPWPLDLTLMQSAAQDILGDHDFTSFAASDPDLANRNQPTLIQPDQRGSTRTVFHSEWTLRDGLYIYRVTGSGFLHHMVRNLIGTFVDIGASRTPADAIPSIVAARNRSAAGPTAPARGLFLIDVEY
jgi:tRNA pseudouridine38-40 synthase